VKLDEFLGGAALRPVWRRTGATPSYEGAHSSTWTDVREFDTAALLALSASRRGRGRDYLSAVLGDATAAERRLGQWRAGRSPDPGAWDGLLGGDARAAFAGLGERHPLAAELHPTRLERYVGCPFAFYVRDVLGLEAPDEPGESLEIEPLEGDGRDAPDEVVESCAPAFDAKGDLRGERLVAAITGGAAAARERGGQVSAPRGNGQQHIESRRARGGNHREVRRSPAAIR